MVICLQRDADCLHMVQLMPLPSQNPTISCLISIQTAFTFLVPAYRVVLEKRPLNGCSTSSFVAVQKFYAVDHCWPEMCQILRDVM